MSARPKSPHPRGPFRRHWAMVITAMVVSLAGAGIAVDLVITHRPSVGSSPCNRPANPYCRPRPRSSPVTTPPPASASPSVSPVSPPPPGSDNPQFLYKTRLEHDYRALDKGVLSYPRLGLLTPGKPVTLSVTITDIGRHPHVIFSAKEASRLSGRVVFSKDVPPAPLSDLS